MFHASIGGYGASGIITEAELDLAPNVAMERQVHRMHIADYPTFFDDHILGNKSAVLHNADMAPPDFDQATSVTRLITDKALTVPDRLVSPEQLYKFEQAVMWGAAKLPVGPRPSIQPRPNRASAPTVHRGINNN